jgi:peptidoglycan/LPS O-acetylase OafA/YrhL
MQFYVAIALAVAAAVRLRRTRLVLPVTLVALAASAVAPFLLWHGGRGANEIYFGTATNLQQLLGGVALAVVWRRGGLDRLPPVVRRLLALAGGVTLAWMLFAVGNVTFKYLGALTVVTAATAAVMVGLLVPGATDRRWPRGLAHPVLTWLGRRSYGIYLWHWPLAEWTNRIPHVYGVPLGIALSLGLAEASWRLVEQPAGRLARRLVRPSPSPPEAGPAPVRAPAAGGGRPRPAAVATGGPTGTAPTRSPVRSGWYPSSRSSVGRASHGS